MKLDILKHNLVPQHEILSKSDSDKLLKSVEFNKEQIPKIKITDPVVKDIEAKVGDILKITRNSQTAGTFVTYRLVED